MASLRKLLQGIACTCLFWAGIPAAQAVLPPKIVIPPHYCSPDTDHRDQPLVIGCWNLEWFPGRNPHHPNRRYARLQSEGIKQVLTRQNPAILVACEVRSWQDLQQLELAYPYLACTEFPPPAGEKKPLPNQGIALLSRLPWQELWALDFSVLPNAPNRPPRGILGAKFMLPNQPALTLYGVHLKSNLGNPQYDRAKRETAIEYLLWDWQRRGLDPQRDCIMVLGDFNTSVHDPTFAQEQSLRRLLAMGFTDAADGLTEDQRITIPANNAGYPDNDFDHILISPALRSLLSTSPPWVKIVRVSYTVSDHYPLFFIGSFRANEKENGE